MRSELISTHPKSTDPRLARLRARCAQRIVQWILCTLSASPCLAAEAPPALTDDRGVSVRWTQPVQRVISLLPSLTETICALGECARLVGVDRYSNWPESVSTLPSVGGGMDPNVEAIVRLQADVVFLKQTSRVAERLEALGLKVFALDTHSHADVRRILIDVAKILQLPGERAQQVWDNIEQGVLAAAQELAPSVKSLRVYIEVNRAPFGASEASFIGETLRQLGAQNVLPAALGPFPKVNPEFIVHTNPDLIIVSARDLPTLLSRPGWDNIRAVKAKRICALSTHDQDVLVRPGPRLAEAARILANCLRAES